MNTLSGKTAVIVGGGSGVGRGISLGLASEGMRIVVADIDVTSATQVKDQILAAGGSAIAFEVDALDVTSLGQLAEKAVATFEKIDVLATTVGVVIERPLEEVHVDEWTWI
jgi:NAD(P)-dependent dehydrogenase (short-subunit alcohol dehydrogenase family)